MILCSKELLDNIALSVVKHKITSSMQMEMVMMSILVRKEKTYRLGLISKRLGIPVYVICQVLKKMGHDYRPHVLSEIPQSIVNDLTKKLAICTAEKFNNTVGKYRFGQLDANFLQRKYSVVIDKLKHISKNEEILFCKELLTEDKKKQAKVSSLTTALLQIVKGFRSFKNVNKSFRSTFFDIIRSLQIFYVFPDEENSLKLTVQIDKVLNYNHLSWNWQKIN